ncbi:MAG: ABC transporter permease, partial [Chloroflexota bacterium]
MNTTSQKFNTKPTNEMRLAVRGIILQRVAFGFLILYVIIYLSHLGLDMSQGTPLTQAFAESFEKSLISLTNIFRGDLGTTRAATGTLRPRLVTEVIKDGLAKSIGLLLFAMSFATILGVLLGTVAAVWRRGRAALPILLITITGISLPSFLIAFLLQTAVIKLGQITGARILPVGGFGWDARIVLPALVLAARPLAQITRVTFVTLRDVLEKDYVRTAYSKGLKEKQVILRHVIRNSLIPILTTIGISVRFSLSSLPVVETFFGWGGIGFLLLGAISQQDAKLTVALVVSLGLIFIIVNALLDIAYRV